MTADQPQPAASVTDETGRSSIKLVRNAKGETQIELKVYEGADPVDVDRARDKATEIYEDLCRRYAGGAGARGGAAA